MTKPAGHNAAFTVAALFALWGTVEFLAFEVNFHQRNPDQFGISKQLPRFEALRDTLPQDAIIGYVSDLKKGTLQADSMFGAAQYALAPRILQWGPEYRWVLGNFANGEQAENWAGQRGLRIQRRFDAGLILFSRETP
jgi:hypothetical protein